MQYVLDLLYRDVIKNLNDTLRFLDADELGHYCECETCLPRQEKELAALLSKERLEKYTDLLSERDNFLQQAIFRRGLALGLRLAALAVL